MSTSLTPDLPEAVPVPAETASPSCPLNELPAETHQYIHSLEQRIAALETQQTRFNEGLINAGKFIFESPMSPMILATMPKAIQQKLREFFQKQ